ncbi:MAG: glutathione peroxidase [Gammaproteobacteria bacterium]|nr:MAG: glutathione peroxidase [Gammaproteobacteria bacterium]
MENREGSAIPTMSFKVQDDNDWESWSTKELFSGKKVILFSLPGAYTPTCSTRHLPRYNELSPIFKEAGIDEIYCLSVNDTFVMNAWKDEQDANNITFLPDGNGEFSEAMGMLVDKSAIGFGKRSWRYSMVVDDGIIQKMFIEPDLPGDPFEVSDADTMLNFLAPDAKEPAKISLMSKPGCPHCNRAKDLLEENGYRFEEIELGSNGVSYSSLAAISGQSTTPQIYIDGQHIGGADDLEKWLVD